MTDEHSSEWAEAKRRCRLSDEEVRMAKELGFKPKTLINNIPAPSQQWKAPVKVWVRELYEEKIGSRKPATVVQPSAEAVPIERNRVIEFRNPEYPWPDRPEIPELVIYEPREAEEDEWEWNSQRRPSEEDLDEENTRSLRRQCLYRWGAQFVAIAMSNLPEVQKVTAFGAVARPLEYEAPRFRRYRYRMEVLHECADLDLAVWLSDLTRLRELKRAMSCGLSLVQNTEYGGVAHHQVDVHVMFSETGSYQGRLCIFGQCPKLGKRECLVPGCGAQPFLQQFKEYSFSSTRFGSKTQVVLFDRASGFLVRPPQMDAKPTRIVPFEEEDGEEF